MPHVINKKSAVPWCITDTNQVVINASFKLKSKLNKTLCNLFGYEAPNQSFNLNQYIKYFDDILEDLKNNGYKPGLEESSDIDSLLNGIKSKYNEHVKKVEEQLKTNQIYFDDLDILFKPGRLVAYNKNKNIGFIDQFYVHQNMFSQYVNIQLISLDQTSDGKVSWVTNDIFINEYSGITNLNNLPLRVITETDPIIPSLISRGKKWFDIVNTPKSYKAYKGDMSYPNWIGSIKIASTGRVMFDSTSLSKINPQEARNLMSRNLASQSKTLETLTKTVFESKPKSELAYALMSDTLVGFSMRARKWGNFEVNNTSDIVWRTDSFDKLVLDNNIKDVIKALVQESSTIEFSDFIDGKGGGTIFLCHGKPGLGKTLTAEATAELLKKPLYAISVGELGTDPVTLEKKLTQALEIASLWDAVVLLDEADIFLESRDEKDILRNAMVGVFLRTLEYFPGVMFLTTNRLKNIDEAFFSRISLALNYTDTGSIMKEQIWTNLLLEAKVNLVPAEITYLAEEFDINGRQIKNIIRNTLILAKSKNKTVTLELLVETAKLSSNFSTNQNTSKPLAIKHSSPDVSIKAAIGFAVTR